MRCGRKMGTRVPIRTNSICEIARTRRNSSSACRPRKARHRHRRRARHAPRCASRDTRRPRQNSCAALARRRRLPLGCGCNSGNTKRNGPLPEKNSVRIAMDQARHRHVAIFPRDRPFPRCSTPSSIRGTTCRRIGHSVFSTSIKLKKCGVIESESLLPASRAPARSDAVTGINCSSLAREEPIFNCHFQSFHFSIGDIRPMPGRVRNKANSLRFQFLRHFVGLDAKWESAPVN